MAGAATPQDLRDALKVTDSQVAVTRATLGSDAIGAVLDEYGAAGVLTIGNAKILSQPDDAFVTVGGDIALLNVTVSGSVRFYIDGSEAQLDLAGTPPAGWKPGDSFAGLAGSYLATLDLSSPGLRLLSQPTADGPRGLTLSAGCALPPALEALRWFAAPAEHATLSGPIALDGGAPSMVLTVSPGISAQLGDFVGIELAMQHISQSFRSAGIEVPSIATGTQLSGNLEFTHNGTKVEVPLTAGMNEKVGVLHLQLVTGNAFDLALGEIAHWLGGTDLGTAGLPSSYQPPAGLTLHDVDFAIGLQTKKLEYVTLTVKSTTSWDVVSKISVSDIVLQFMLMPAGSPKVSATIVGTLALGTAAALDVYAQVPDFLIRGHLAEGSAVNLVPLIEYLGGATAELPTTLQIDEIAFEAHPAGSHYTFDIDVIGDWQIVDEVTFKELRASLRYDNSDLDVTLAGRFQLGGVDLAVSAEYRSDPGGWLFSGRAADETSIKIGAFIQGLVTQFSSTAAQAMPDVFTSLEIAHLGVSYDTSTKAFVFHCQTQFSIAGKALDLALEITLKKGDGEGSYSHHYGGVLIVGDLSFELFFEQVKAGGDAQAISTFLAAVQPDAKIDLRKLAEQIDDGAGALMPALSLDLENALLLYRKTEGAPGTYLFGLALGLDVDMSSLPLIGSVLHDNDLGGIKDIQLVYASADVAADDVGTFNALLGEAQAKPPLPIKAGVAGRATALNKGFNFAANLQMGGSPMPLAAGGTTAPPGGAAPPPAPAAPVPPSGNATWLDVKKSIGPVTLERIGVRYEDGRAWLLVDADLVLSGLSLGLQGLAIGLKLDDLKSVPAVNLDGLSLDFESGPLSIAGGFLRYGGDYIGEARVKAATFGLTAIGGYAPSEQSFFIFVRLNMPLGGPPFFFVTGLAGGFGINRNLTLPPIDQLTSFALLPANNNFPPSLGDNPGASLASTLASTEAYIQPRPGQNWVAAGIDFTSFEMVDSSALVTVAFGVEFAVSLLGICRITVPKLDPEAIVYLEITLEASLKPAQGILAVDGRLTPASYLYARLCRITGGFAFYLWFGGEHEGDFVISIGGYHPRFKKPDHYPAVPRLQLVYQIGSLVIKGESYLALTPHMVMAGLRIDATWESGSLSAWFSAGIDFLLGWKPFHYEADAFVHIGVSLTIDLLFTSIRITIHVGVDLSIWGPAFGGRATIDVDVCSFTIHFGADPRQEAIDWAGFKSSFLPAGSDKAAATQARATRTAAARADTLAATPETGSVLCTGSAAEGLVKDLKAKDAGAFFSWIVDANHFALQSNTLIPAKQATYNGFDLNTPFTKAAPFAATATGPVPTPAYDEGLHPNGISWTDQLGILPMQFSAKDFTTSHHVVEIMRPGEGDDYTVAANYVHTVSEISLEPLVKAASSALWAPSDPGLNGARLVPETLVGLRITPMAQHPDITLKADLWAMLFDQNLAVSSQADAPAPDRQDDYNATADGPALSFQLGGKTVTCEGYKLTALTDDAAAAARKAVVAGLNGLGFALDPGAIDLADTAQYPLWDWPMIRTLGEEVAVS